MRFSKRRRLAVAFASILVVALVLSMTLIGSGPAPALVHASPVLAIALIQPETSVLPVQVTGSVTRSLAETVSDSRRAKSDCRRGYAWLLHNVAARLPDSTQKTACGGPRDRPALRRFQAVTGYGPRRYLREYRTHASDMR